LAARRIQLVTSKNFPPDPQAIGDFTILGKLAAGPLVTVYRACDPATGQEVAIKLAAEQIVDNPVLLKRFEQEYTVARGLNHPHLVRALSFGQLDRAPYIVFELVDGPSLGDRIEAEKHLAEGEAVRIVAEVAEGLHEAHKKRIIHRDIKPDNVLLTAAGQAKLADLGLAKDVDGQALLTRPATGLGTPNFIAPEQFSDAKHADVRCDIYGLGATLHMAVTGELPFQARGIMGILKKKLAGDITPPRKLVPELSPRVERAILCSLDPNPRQRYPSCTAFLKDLLGKSSLPCTARASLPDAAAGEPPQGKPEGADRRATVRFPSRQQGACQPLGEEKDLKWSAKVQDVSADGIGLVLNRAFQPRTVLLVDLGGAAQAAGRRLLVRVVRCQKLSARSWLVGCVFARRLAHEDCEALA
jgi:serine/threonine protein kinase